MLGMLAKLDGVRVLVVDDDALVRAALGRQLKKLGCVPSFAASGLEGIAMAGEEPYDAAIVDLHMPEMSGEEAIGRIRQRSGVPVIVISAALNLRRAVLDSVARLPKPFELHELQAALEAAVVVRRN